MCTQRDTAAAAGFLDESTFEGRFDASGPAQPISDMRGLPSSCQIWLLTILATHTHNLCDSKLTCWIFLLRILFGFLSEFSFWIPAEFIWITFGLGFPWRHNFVVLDCGLPLD
jgi:hypothetical protein